MNRERLFTLIKDLTIWKRGDSRAPHKPLLVLLAIGYLQNHDQRLIPYKEVDSKLKYLLKEYGPPRKSYHPEYPYWRLQNDGVWFVEDKNKLESRESNTDAKKSELINKDVHAGFKHEIYQMLREDSDLINRVCSLLLNEHFSETLHEDILRETGVTLDIKYLQKRNKRQSAFRADILSAYEHRCAICEFDVRIGNTSIGVEAAHIKWRSAGGPDIVENGIALCALHHKLFDLGAFTIDQNFQFLLSEKVMGSKGFEDWLGKYHGHEIVKPISSNYYPDYQFISWNHEEVFKKPHRKMI